MAGITSDGIYMCKSCRFDTYCRICDTGDYPKAVIFWNDYEPYDGPIEACSVCGKERR